MDENLTTLDLTPESEPAAESTPGTGRRHRALKVGAALGLAFGVAAGAAVVAGAVTGHSGPSTTGAGTMSSSSDDGGSGSTSTPSNGPGASGGGPGGFGGHFAGGAGGPGGGFGGFGGGQVLHGEYTIAAPGGGYETLEEQNGTVTSVTDTSGSTYSLVVTSADGDAITYVVDSGTSIDGGETGISSLANGDDVSVTAVVSGGTATAKEITDSTVMKANGQSWMPKAPSGSGSSSSSSSTSS